MIAKIADGFVVLAIESFWTRLFSQYFIENHDETRDDLLFFVKGKNGPREGQNLANTEVGLSIKPLNSRVLICQNRLICKGVSKPHLCCMIVCYCIYTIGICA